MRSDRVRVTCPRRRTIFARDLMGEAEAAVGDQDIGVLGADLLEFGNQAGQQQVRRPLGDPPGDALAFQQLHRQPARVEALLLGGAGDDLLQAGQRRLDDRAVIDPAAR